MKHNKFETLFQNDNLECPNPEAMWSQINQKREKKPRRNPFKIILTTIAALFLFTTITVSAAYYIKLNIGESTVQVEDGEGFHMLDAYKIDEEDVDPNLLVAVPSITREEAERIAPFPLRNPTYLPEGYDLVDEGGQNGIPVFEPNGEVVMVDESFSYTLVFSKNGMQWNSNGEDLIFLEYFIQDTSHIAGISKDLIIDEDKNTRYVEKSNPKQITVAGHSAIQYNNGIMVWKELSEDQVLQIEIQSSGTISNEELLKVLQSLEVLANKY